MKIKKHPFFPLICQPDSDDLRKFICYMSIEKLYFLFIYDHSLKCFYLSGGALLA